MGTQEVQELIDRVARLSRELKEAKQKIEELRNERDSAVSDVWNLAKEHGQKCKYCMYYTSKRICKGCDGWKWNWRGFRK